MRPPRLIARSGFSVIEIIVSVMLLSMIVVTVSQLLSKTSRAQLVVSRSRDAGALATMVFEQYSSYARSNFAALKLYDVQKVDPKLFFGKSDNLGFDGFNITTNTEYGLGRSSATIHVTIGWVGSSTTLHMTRHYTEQVHLQGGAILPIFVKEPCPAGTTPEETIQFCPGIPRLKVTVNNEQQNSLVHGITDERGLAMITGVVGGDGIKLKIEPPEEMSDYQVDPSSPSFVQGYYAVDSAGNFITHISSTITVDDRIVEPRLFTNYLPAAAVTGTVVMNDPDKSARIRLINDWHVAIGGKFLKCDDIACWALTDPVTGRYTIGNVVKFNGRLRLEERNGSNWLIRPGQAGWSQGFTGTSNYTVLTGSDWQGNPPRAVKDIPTIEKGSVRLRVRAPGNTGPVPFAKIEILGLAKPNFDYTFITTNYTTDANGEMFIYNLVDSSHENDGLFIVAKSPSGDGYKKMYWFPTDAHLGVQTTVDVELIQQYTLRVSFVDDNPSPQDLSWAIATVYQGSWISANLDASLTASMYFCPECLGISPGTPFNPFVALSKILNPPFHGQASGKVVDVLDTSKPAEGAVLGIAVDGVGFFFSTASTSGYFLTPDLTFDWNQSNIQGPSFTCDSSTRLCEASGPYHVDTSKGSRWAYNFSLWDPTNQAYWGWHLTGYGQPVYFVNGGVSTHTVLTAELKEYQVTGLVKSASSGAGVGGITVKDPVSKRTVVSSDGTDGRPIGTYTIWCNVQGRTSGNTSSGSTGTVQTMVPEQEVGTTHYNEVTAPTITIPTPATPMIPLPMDIEVGGSTTSHI